MPQLDIHVEKDDFTAARSAALAISQRITSYGALPILFLVSGGSPLEILTHLSADGFNGRVTVGVSDERYSIDPAVNNFAQMVDTSWYKRIVVAGVRSIDTRPVAGETVEGAGRRFDTALKEWKQENPMGKVIITQGIGLDGHTAGMMPYPEDERMFGFLFDNPDVWAVGYDAKGKNKYPLRVTTTLPFLRMVDDSILYVCGEEKKKALVYALEAPGSFTPDRKDSEHLGALVAVPARIIHDMPHCLLYTDLTVDTLK